MNDSYPDLIWKLSVCSVTFGVMLATLAKPSSSNHLEAESQYWIGIMMLTAALILTGVLGVLQERTYSKYGPCWQEGVFYTVPNAWDYLHIYN